MASLRRLTRVFTAGTVEREIDEELRLHFDLLLQEQLERGFSPEKAHALAKRRFGDFQKIKDQCLVIGRKASPWMRAAKSLLIMMAFVGISIRAVSSERDIRHAAALLIVIPILVRLLLYVRGLRPSHFLSKNHNSSVLGVSSVNSPQGN